MTTKEIHMENLNSVYFNGYWTEVCDACLSNWKTPPAAQTPITDPLYMTECVLCHALPVMKLVRCIECQAPDTHPYDQYHAEAFCMWD